LIKIKTTKDMVTQEQNHHRIHVIEMTDIRWSRKANIPKSNSKILITNLRLTIAQRIRIKRKC